MSSNIETWIVRILVAACLYGLYSGADLVLDAQYMQRVAQGAKQQILHQKVEKTDRPLFEIMGVAALALQEKLQPGAVKLMEVTAKEIAVRGYAIVAGSILAFVLVVICYFKLNRRTSAGRIR